MALAPSPTNGFHGNSRQLLVPQRSQQNGVTITLTVTILMVIALFLLKGPFELARVTWLLSQSVEGCIEDLGSHASGTSRRVSFPGGSESVLSGTQSSTTCDPPCKDKDL